MTITPESDQRNTLIVLGNFFKTLYVRTWKLILIIFLELQEHVLSFSLSVRAWIDVPARPHLSIPSPVLQQGNNSLLVSQSVQIVLSLLTPFDLYNYQWIWSTGHTQSFEQLRQLWHCLTHTCLKTEKIIKIILSKQQEHVPSFSTLIWRHFQLLRDLQAWDQIFQKHKFDVS